MTPKAKTEIELIYNISDVYLRGVTGEGGGALVGRLPEPLIREEEWSRKEGEGGRTQHSGMVLTYFNEGYLERRTYS